MARGDEHPSPINRKDTTTESIRIENAGNKEGFLSPRFRSAAAMAGWDEEALLVAALIVEDTPERESKYKKRLGSQFKTPPPTNSGRKRRFQRQTPPVALINEVIILDDDKNSQKTDGKEKKVTNITAVENKKEEEDEGSVPKESSRSGSVLPCMDRLREELSCAICLEMCFEPTTTTCGHSFCKKCLKFAADKCGKRCPKCRQLISNGRSCTVNTVLWNTIQLLFPEEIEARKVAMAETGKQEAKEGSQKNGGTSTTPSMALDSNITANNGRRRTRRGSYQDNATSTFQSNIDGRRRSDLSREEDPALAFQRNGGRRRSRWGPNQEVDAALALRLQREEFMEAFRENNENEQPSSSFISARANFRAMASGTIHLRFRGQPT